MESGKHALKTVVALAGLAIACGFTYYQIFGGSGATHNAELSREVEPAAAPEEKPKTTSQSPEGSASTPKALSWEDYLSYDPFKGWNEPNAELYALALNPSPFYSDDIPIQAKNGKALVPSSLTKLSVEAILGDLERKIAIINGRPYSQGEILLDESNNPIVDPEFGTLKLSRVEANGISIETGGRQFSISMKSFEPDFVLKPNEKNSPKFEEKKSE